MINQENKQTFGSRLTLGIDVGSRTTKAVVWDGSRVVDRTLTSTGWSPAEAIDKVHAGCIDRNRGIERIVACGFARGTVSAANRTITEITAHARGIAAQLKGVRTLIDVGGQDLKVTRIDENGLVCDFAMNDRCAAGSGRFLEYLALTMGVTVDEFSQIGLQATKTVRLSSICTVFAESEMLSLLAEGTAREDIARAVHHSIARRIVQMAEPLRPEGSFAISGGGAYNACLVKELEKLFDNHIMVPEYPEFTGALGSAIFAFEEG
jgi:predicted CoA-substrate-specific enzyme activase